MARHGNFAYQRTERRRFCVRSHAADRFNLEVPKTYNDLVLRAAGFRSILRVLRAFDGGMVSALSVLPAVQSSGYEIHGVNHEPEGTTVFETAAFDHSATSPNALKKAYDVTFVEVRHSTAVQSQSFRLRSNHFESCA